MLLEEDTTYALIGSARRVHDILGSGFLEAVYVKALAHECRKKGLRVEAEVPTPVYYDGVIVGAYRVDLMVNGRVIVEVKSCERLAREHFKQVLHYLKCTDNEVALLLNFGAALEVRRFVYRNALKRSAG